ncbi:flagellar biosynthetic protein FliQ [Microbulbifer salipaludis]|uniref:Flagellar biosynthetic protein FliQ n=1 Tax=Microbulbifer salipaludis TaxID=187980 RepID=A0ABS3EA48_9GAMM|nr:flagellar biosynthetic protein FliQ [Microbulbifer salipaludis]MBN8432166.1 flagellar biosynthetic protein FliQ [Microbulbifer salipaludis]
MEPDTAMRLMASMLEVAAWMSAPVLAAALFIGLFVSIFQVVTQIQEMSLTFVPKIIGAVVVLILMGNWILATWMEFAEKSIGMVAG